MLVCLGNEVLIWDLETCQNVGHVPVPGALDAAFSANGQRIVVGDSRRTTIWDAATRVKVFVSTEPPPETEPQTMSLSEAMMISRTCGPSALRLSFFMKTSNVTSVPSHSARSLTELTTDNIGEIVPPNIDTTRTLMYCGQVIAHRAGARMTISMLQK